MMQRWQWSIICAAVALFYNIHGNAQQCIRSLDCAREPAAFEMSDASGRIGVNTDLVQGLLPIKTHHPAGRSLKETDFEMAGSPIPVRNETDIFQVMHWLVLTFF
jgi:hypothetical protein